MFELIGHLLTIHYILNDAIYIIDNEIDVRIVADDNKFCNVGRVEFYDGVNWGSFSDCSMQVTNDIASSICQTLGWDRAESFKHGPYSNNADRTTPQYITYTNMYCPDICSVYDCDVCVNCQISNDFDNKCGNTSINELHSSYDIYVMCSNQHSGVNPSSNLYNCTDYMYPDSTNTTKQIYNNPEWHLDTFGSCQDAFEGDDTEKHSNVWKFCVVVGIMVAAILCMLAYCKTTRRMPHKKFTEAYMENLENDTDIMLDTTKTTDETQTIDHDVGTDYTSLLSERKLSLSKESLLDD